MSDEDLAVWEQHLDGFRRYVYEPVFAGRGFSLDTALLYWITVIHNRQLELLRRDMQDSMAAYMKRLKDDNKPWQPDDGDA